MKKHAGQALLELSIFGALFLVFLGVLISSGLQYNYQQQVMQRTFRKALYYSNLEQQKERGSITYVSIEDRHSPDPLDTFAVGSVGQYSSSASVTRDYEMNKSADDINSLPAIAIDITGMDVCPGSGGPPGLPGSPAPQCSTCSDDDCRMSCQISPPGTSKPCFYLTAGFSRWYLGDSGECNTRMDKLKKYEFIFGQLNIEKYKVDWWGRWNPGNDDLDEWNGNIRIIDSCEGEILSLGACRRQCSLITDPALCLRACRREGNFDCGFCSAVITEPWYCGQLNALFALAQDYAMGLQKNTFSATREHNAFEKRETPAQIATTDTLNWSRIIENMFVFRPYGDTSGSTQTHIMSSSTGQDETQKWTTQW
jgi:hypothetical protein